MTVNIHGKDYVTVAERVAMVHESGKAFEIVASEPLQVGDRWLWRVVVKIDDRQYIGTAEAKVTNARNGSPDASNPFECAETSAIGRALGFAGFGAIESIASADEIVRGQAKENKESDSAQSPALFNLIAKAKNRAADLNCAHNKSEWEAFLQECTGEVLTDKDLTMDKVARVNGKLTQIERERQKTAASAGGK